MKKVFQEQSVQPGLFWDAVLKADLVLPLTRPFEEDMAQSNGMEDMPVQLGLDSSGKRILWIFTSVSALEEYTEKSLPCYKCNGKEMFERIKETGLETVLIGPDRITLGLDDKLVDSLAEGTVPQPPAESERVLTKETKLMVSRPSDSTAELEETFSDLFKSMPDVLEAAFLQVSDETGSRLLLGLRLESESRDDLKRVAMRVAKAAEGVMEPGKTMDVTLIGGSLNEAFQKWGKTFYRK